MTTHHFSDPAYLHAFEQAFAYEGELGAIYHPSATCFKLWAPTADQVSLVLFRHGREYACLPMEKHEKGVWIFTQTGDLQGTEYLYGIQRGDEQLYVVDPYATACTLNGERGVVFAITPSDVPSPLFETTPIIYELHVRDISVHPDSGIQHKARFLGLTETGTQTSNGQITGLDYIKSLGVTHVQLLPIFHFSPCSVDERAPLARYNWGYDPLHYNCPAGVYATQPEHPQVRIVELQKMIDCFHQNGLGVIMDVVYNHVFEVGEHPFNQILPNYYFRQDKNGQFLNGTFVGNEIASERKMVRKFIVDSVKFWATHYRIDGFRFDLMGILDIETLNTLRAELAQINPHIFILGEGWEMGHLDPALRATQTNAQKLPHIAFFNDSLRDAIKGSALDEKGVGFVNGDLRQAERLFQHIQGGQGLNRYLHPKQLIQYVEAHDNLTLWDKLVITQPEDSEDTRLKRHKLATSIALLAQGVPFLHAGQEFARSKQGDENSYCSPDAINQFDWDYVMQRQAHIEYVRQLIAIRKQHHLFHLNDYATIQQKLKAVNIAPQFIAYALVDEQQQFYVFHNAQQQGFRQTGLCHGEYDVLVEGDFAQAEGIRTMILAGDIEVPALSTLVLRKIS